MCGNRLPGLRVFHVAAVLWAFTVLAASCGDATAPQPRCEGVRLETTSLNPRVGEVSHVGAAGITTGGVTVSGSTFRWESSNPTVATVDQSGVVTALSVGTTTITVTCTNATANAPVQSSVVITVRPPLVELLVRKQGTGDGSYSIAPPGTTHEAGTVVGITATPAEGSVFDGFTGPCTVNGRTCTVTMSPPGPVEVTTTFTLCDKSYCGTITLPYIYLSWQTVGFGYNWTGYADLAFDPAPPGGMRLHARLNAASVSGSATTTGDTTLRISLSGSSVACMMVNPSTLVITDLDHPIPVLAIITVTWYNPGCG